MEVLEAVAEDLRGAMAAEGIQYAGPLYIDGKVHRFDADGDRRGSKNGWYRAHPDGRPAGRFGHWVGERSFPWKFRGPVQPGRFDPERARRTLQQREDAQEASHADAAGRAQAIWRQAQDAAQEALHPYLARKGVLPFGVRVGDWIKERHYLAPGEPPAPLVVRNTLLVPVQREGKLFSLQGIAADPEAARGLMHDKEFLKGGRAAGCYHAIGGRPVLIDGRPVIIVCEGYATGASIHQATGHFVLVAFNCGNLKPVAEFARSVRPGAKIIIAADNDLWTMRGPEPWNPGVERAMAAAHAVGGQVVVPRFPSLKDRPTDFNDLHARAGLDDVARQINAGIDMA